MSATDSTVVHGTIPGIVPRSFTRGMEGKGMEGNGFKIHPSRSVTGRRANDRADKQWMADSRMLLGGVW